MKQLYFKLLCILGLKIDKRVDHEGRARWIRCVAASIDAESVFEPEYEKLEAI